MCIGGDMTKRTIIVIATVLAILLALSLGAGAVSAGDDEVSPPATTTQIQGCSGDCANCQHNLAPAIQFKGCGGSCASCPRHLEPAE